MFKTISLDFRNHFIVEFDLERTRLGGRTPG